MQADAHRVDTWPCCGTQLKTTAIVSVQRRYLASSTKDGLLSVKPSGIHRQNQRGAEYARSLQWTQWHPGFRMPEVEDRSCRALAAVRREAPFQVDDRRRDVGRERLARHGEMRQSHRARQVHGQPERNSSMHGEQSRGFFVLRRRAALLLPSDGPRLAC
jgi:hypothetical protein